GCGSCAHLIPSQPDEASGQSAPPTLVMSETVLPIEEVEDRGRPSLWGAMRAPIARGRVRLRTLSNLRWLAVAGQSTALFIVRFARDRHRLHLDLGLAHRFGNRAHVGGSRCDAAGPGA